MMKQPKPEEFAAASRRMTELRDVSVDVATFKESIPYLPKIQAIKLLRSSGLCENLGEAVAAYIILKGGE